MISIKEISYSYNNKYKVLNQTNLDLKEGMIHGLVGLNGSGKTTLLKCLFGLLKVQSGGFYRNEIQLSKKEVSFLSTENYFYPNISGKDYLLLFSRDKKEIKSWNDLFKLPLDQLIDQYSTGMKKKLALMGIFLQKKDIIILDEPYNGLDIESGRIIQLILNKLKTKGKTILITSHILSTLSDICDYIHYLDNGSIKFSEKKNNFEKLEKYIFQNIDDENESIIKGLP